MRLTPRDARPEPRPLSGWSWLWLGLVLGLLTLFAVAVPPVGTLLVPRPAPTPPPDTDVAAAPTRAPTASRTPFPTRTATASPGPTRPAGTPTVQLENPAVQITTVSSLAEAAELAGFPVLTLASPWPERLALVEVERQPPLSPVVVALYRTSPDAPAQFVPGQVAPGQVLFTQANAQDYTRRPVYTGYLVNRNGQQYAVVESAQTQTRVVSWFVASPAGEVLCTLAVHMTTLPGVNDLLDIAESARL